MKFVIINVKELVFFSILLLLTDIFKFGVSFTTYLQTLREISKVQVSAPEPGPSARAIEIGMAVSSSNTNVMEQEIMKLEKYEEQVELLQEQPKERVHSIKSPFLQMNDDTKTDTDTDTGTNAKYMNAFIILNSPIEIHSSLNDNEESQSSPSSSSPLSYNINPIFDTLWNISSYRVCADGGANRLYDATEKARTNNQCSHNTYTNTNINANANANKKQYIPNLIKGDLDSVHRDVVRFYEQNGCQIIQDFDQNTNDLDKALQEVHGWRSGILSKTAENDCTEEGQVQGKDGAKKDGNEDDNENNNEIVVQVYIYGAFGGRFDQEMASIQALYKWADAFDYRIFLYNHETCSWLLKPVAMLDEHDKNVIHDNYNNCCVKNEISIPFYGEKGREEGTRPQKEDGIVVGEGPTCGLIPIGCKSNRVKTKGLKWDLDGSSASTLEFGGLVSSSNRAMEDVVTVYTSDPLVFTAEIIINGN